MGSSDSGERGIWTQGKGKGRGGGGSSEVVLFSEVVKYLPCIPPSMI